MAYTVRQVSKMSGVSVRTLHFYDETGLLKPAFHGTNGYRYYEEPQLLTLQQVLFYRELGFDLKQIKQILHRPDFEKLTALQSHREVLDANLIRTRTLLDTLDKTIAHLKGISDMKSEDMFSGFSVAAGKDRFDEHVQIGGEPNDCKVSGQDTNGAMCIFEFTGTGGGPRHLHHEQDEWVYVLQGEIDLEVGTQQRRICAGESVFLPRRLPHGWASTEGRPAKIVNVYQPAGKMEAFFREVGQYQGTPQIHQALSSDQLQQLFHDHGMEIAGPPLTGEWNVDEDGRIVQTA